MKKYLGKAADLTFTRLEEIAHLLQGNDATVAHPPASPRAMLAQHETGEALARAGDMQGAPVFLQQTNLLLQARLFQLQGSFQQAVAVYAHMMQVPGDPQGTLIHPGYSFGLGELFYLQNDLDTAQRLMEQGRAALRGPLALAGDAIARGYATLARLYTRSVSSTTRPWLSWTSWKNWPPRAILSRSSWSRRRPAARRWS